MTDWVNEQTFLDDAATEEKYIFWPRRCSLTNELLWLTFAVRGRRTQRTGSERIIHEDHWYDPEAFVLFRMKYGC